MSKTIVKKIMPDAKVHRVSLHEGRPGSFNSICSYFSLYWLRLAYIELDGDQVLDFFWIDPIDAAKRFISKPKFAGKLYTRYERQDSLRRPGKRAFGRANSGLVFQSAQFIDIFSSPLLLLFYADKTFSGKHRTHHPIYSKLYFMLNIFKYTWNILNYLKLPKKQCIY
jgi:hypothetical protein